MKYGHLENVDDIHFSLPKENKKTISLLANLTPIKKPNIYIGGPVFSDKTFIGTIYPLKTKNKDFLTAYSQQFNCIEVNSTRFGVPTEKTQNAWKSKVNNDFKFSFKMPQVITHRKNMNDIGGQIQTDKFLQCLANFDTKAGMTYMLLPNYFKMERWTMLQQFLQNYPTDLPLTIEARNTDFQESDEVYDFLQEKNITLAITDVAGRRDVLHQTLVNDTIFIRFGGANLHPSDYTRIDEWALKITRWINEGVKNVYFYIHQPTPNKYNMGILIAHLIEKLNKLNSNLSLKAPIDYRKN